MGSRDRWVLGGDGRVSEGDGISVGSVGSGSLEE